MESNEIPQSVVGRFHFIDDLHPADFILHMGELDGRRVPFLCWLDSDAQLIRPLAIILTDEDMPLIKIQGESLEQTSSNLNHDLRISGEPT